MLFDNNNVDMDYTFMNLAGLTNSNNMMDNMNINYPSNNDLNLFSSKEGFLRGNMFKDLYKPYKNLTFINIRPKNDREAKLFNVMQYAFAITDLNLYLDTHPEDKEALNVLKILINEDEKAKKEYIMSYGPLTVVDTEGNDYKWIDSPWPWENMGGNRYV